MRRGSATMTLACICGRIRYCRGEADTFAAADAAMRDAPKSGSLPAIVLAAVPGTRTGPTRPKRLGCSGADARVPNVAGKSARDGGRSGLDGSGSPGVSFCTGTLTTGTLTTGTSIPAKVEVMAPGDAAAAGRSGTTTGVAGTGGITGASSGTTVRSGAAAPRVGRFFLNWQRLVHNPGRGKRRRFSRRGHCAGGALHCFTPVLEQRGPDRQVRSLRPGLCQQQEDVFQRAACRVRWRQPFLSRAGEQGHQRTGPSGRGAAAALFRPACGLSCRCRRTARSSVRSAG